MKKEISKFVEKKPFVHCRCLGRKCSVQKFLEANVTRTKALQRLRCFFAAIDILKYERHYTVKIIDGKRCFSLFGKDKNGTLIELHLREEIDDKKNKRLYFISCFPKKKAPTS